MSCLVGEAAARNAGGGDATGLGFTAGELAANRRGELLASQFPVPFWELIGLGALGWLVVVGARWALGHRHGRERHLVAALALLCLLPVGVVAIGAASGVVSALRDWSDARACAFTHVASGVRPSWYDITRYYVHVGGRVFPGRRGGPARAQRAIHEGSAYTVYSACHSGTLAALEQAPADWKPPGRAQHLAELKELLDVDDADLAANRAGDLHLHQLPLLRLASALFLAALFAATSAVHGLGLRKKSKLEAESVFWVLMLGAASAGTVYVYRGSFQDALERRTCTLAGEVTRRELRVVHKGDSYWQLTVNGKMWELSRAPLGLALLRIGSRYRVHYLCHSRELASIEPLP
jgi:hypothetical protein